MANFSFQLDTQTQHALELVAQKHERKRGDLMRFLIRREAERLTTNSEIEKAPPSGMRDDPAHT